MSYDYEAQTVRELASIVRKGALYRRKRPVHWCIRDVTALAEAEVEYQEKTSPSIYVGFRVVKGAPEGEPWFLAIWTTTPWTIPANLAVAINPELEYVAYLVPGRGRFVVAKALLHAFLGATFPDELRAPQKGGDDLLSAARATGATLAHPDRVRDVDPEELRTFEYRHPLADRTGIVVFGEHATAETGTGLVHTAPGHGEEDFRMGLEYGLPIWAPVDGYGKFTSDVAIAGLEGKKVFDANPVIVDMLQSAQPINGGSRSTAKSISRGAGRPPSARRRWRPSTRSPLPVDGCRPGARTGSAGWWRTVPTGASRGSAAGAFPSRSRTARSIASRSSTRT